MRISDWSSDVCSSDLVSLLRAIGQTMGSRGGALIGIDLQKARSIVEPAYNDANGITAHFTLTLLLRLNREMGCDFDPDGFSHHATYIEPTGRIETFLTSRWDQEVHVEGRSEGRSVGTRCVSACGAWG